MERKGKLLIEEPEHNPKSEVCGNWIKEVSETPD
jgi:hypothetical protein